MREILRQTWVKPSCNRIERLWFKTSPWLGNLSTSFCNLATKVILVTIAFRVFITRLLSRTRWRVVYKFVLSCFLKCFESFSWHKKLSKISWKIEGLLKYLHLEGMTLNFRDFHWNVSLDRCVFLSPWNSFTTKCYRFWTQFIHHKLSKIPTFNLKN